MAEVQSAPYLSIGEVLGLLLEDFPDVTISKIRFLESQGLISPERTPSGYRKFYDDDVELLRVILTEQRQNYLPLRVIKDRLETGEIDPTGEHRRDGDDGPDASEPPDPAVEDDQFESPDVPSASIASHPASRATSDHSTHDTASESDAQFDAELEVAAPSDGAQRPDLDRDSGDDAPAVAPQMLAGVLLDRSELCAMVGMTESELEQLESFGIVAPREGAGLQLYGEDAVEIARPASEFLRLGVDARHLRNWRTSAEREVSLYEQLVTPRFRQRNPEARAEALAQLEHFDALGASLRAALTRNALRHHFEG